MLVAPGDDLGSSSDLDPGHGVIVVDGRLKAVKQGRICLLYTSDAADD